MNTCSNCGTQNVEGVRFCVQCGTQLAPPAGSWRGEDAGSAPFGAPPPSQPAPGSSPNANAYVPPYAPPPTDFASPPPPVFNSPLPAMSYATHGAAGSGAPTEYATWGQRALGYLVDLGATLGVAMLLYAVVLLPVFLLGGIGGGGPRSFPVLPFLGMGLVWLLLLGFSLYNDIYLRSTRGATIGQGVAGLKTVTASGETPSLGSLVLRFIVKLGLAAIPCLGTILTIVDYLFPIWDEKKQTIHDKVAGTFVVKT